MQLASSMAKQTGLLLLLVFLAAFLPACSEEKPKGPPPRPPVPVKIAKATSRNVPVTLRAVGTVEAQASVELRARVGGQLAKVHFREGQDVHQGAPLFTIDPEPFQVALRRSEAQLVRQQALATTAREKERRYAVLVNEGLISRQDYDLLSAEAAALEAAVAADSGAQFHGGLRLDGADRPEGHRHIAAGGLGDLDRNRRPRRRALRVIFAAGGQQGGEKNQ